MDSEIWTDVYISDVNYFYLTSLDENEPKNQAHTIYQAEKNSIKLTPNFSKQQKMRF